MSVKVIIDGELHQQLIAHFVEVQTGIANSIDRTEDLIKRGSQVAKPGQVQLLQKEQQKVDGILTGLRAAETMREPADPDSM